MRTRIILILAALLVGTSMVSAQGVITRPTKPQGGGTSSAKPQVSNATGKINGYEYVDLGLSVKWARYNVGATSPTGYGNYYAWGETSTKSEYTVANSAKYGKNMGDISGNSNYDVVRARWGGSWRLPTASEIDELINKCKWKWTTVGGVKGYKVTGPNGNSIFLSAAGSRVGSSPCHRGEDGIYWSSTPDKSDTYNAYYLLFDSGYVTRFCNSRCFGFSIRPVSE